MRRRLTAALLVALASAPALAQAQASAANPYSAVLLGAQQVILHAPELYSPDLVNALRQSRNVNVPVTVVTTMNGALQENGLILRLAVLRADVFVVPAGGDRRVFMQVRHGNDWRVYDVSGAAPIPGRSFDYREFNTWYGQARPRLQPLNPAALLAAWARMHLGVQMN